MVKAVVNGKVIAESDDYEEVEGNVYFPPEAIHKKYLDSSDHTTTCPWKGKATYYHIKVDGKTIENVAWTYKEPKEKAQHIKNYVAFYTNKINIEQ